jgi:hypothetical protein
LPDGLPTVADFIDLVGAYFCKIEACLNCMARKTGVVLITTDAFFRNGKEKLSIPNDAGGGIVHLRIIQSKSDQAEGSGCFLP